MITVIAVGFAIAFSPTPAGVSAQAWHLLAIFVATILGFILKPLPMGAMAILGISATAISGTLSIKIALSGFANTTIWLIGIAFFIARSFIKTGLGMRLAYHFMILFGKKSLGLSYGLGLADLFLAPAMPSNTARAGGIVSPLILSVSQAYGSDPRQGTEKKLGSFLVSVAFNINIITSAMFLTAMAANPLCVKFAADAGITISWTTWFVAASVPAFLSFGIIPLVIYFINPPELKRTPEAKRIAQEKLSEMGPMKRSEFITLGVFFTLLALWIGGATLGIHTTTAAFVGLSLLLISEVLSWDDILAEKGAWDTITWFAALVMMASQLNELGFIAWLGEGSSALVGNLPWQTAFLAVVLIYFFSHYLFASQTAHISAMYAPFLAVSLMVGTPPLYAALVLGFVSNIYSSLTHYANGPAPVLFGMGYVSTSQWWFQGIITGLINLLIWLGVGSLWWHFLGYM